MILHVVDYSFFQNMQSTGIQVRANLEPWTSEPELPLDAAVAGCGRTPPWQNPPVAEPS
jgi:hypothetical protein